MILFINSSQVFANEFENNHLLINDWIRNKNLSKIHLEKAEFFLKRGDKMKACQEQNKASFYGEKSLASLRLAFEFYKKDFDPDLLATLSKKLDNLGEKCN